MSNSIWLKASNQNNVNDSTVDFPTKTRFHIALNVKNVVSMTPFYVSLFGDKPHTEREGYAKFTADEPPINLSLNEVPKNAKGNGEFGIQAKTADAVIQIEKRLQQAGFKTSRTNNGTTELNVVTNDVEGNQWNISQIKLGV